MSVLAMSEAEVKNIDSKVEQMMDWAKTRQAEAEQLALDSTRLMACTTERLDKLQKQNFFIRCWTRFNGDASSMEQANVNDVIQMQKTAFRYVNMLQDQQLLMAHSLLSLKNNLISLAIKERETRELITNLAERTLKRFESLENRVDQIEISTNLQGWLLGLEERDYNEKIPTPYMRLFRIINDFYSIKNDNWNFNDLMFMRKAIRTVQLDPKQKLSINDFISNLIDEIQREDIGFDLYRESITMFVPKGIDDYSKFVIDNISSPVFVSMHGLKIQYRDRLDIVEELQTEMNISLPDALKRILRRTISNMNVNIDYEFPLAETAIEILGCLRLSNMIYINNLNKYEVKVDKIENQNYKISHIFNKIEKLPLSCKDNIFIKDKISNLSKEYFNAINHITNKSHILMYVMPLKDTDNKYVFTDDSIYIIDNTDKKHRIFYSDITKIKWIAEKIQIITHDNDYIYNFNVINKCFFVWYILSNIINEVNNYSQKDYSKYIKYLIKFNFKKSSFKNNFLLFNDDKKIPDISLITKSKIKILDDLSIDQIIVYFSYSQYNWEEKFFMTSSFIYYKNYLGEENCIPYSRIEKVAKDKSGLSIYASYNSYNISCVDEEVINCAIKTISDIIDYKYIFFPIYFKDKGEECTIN